LAEIATWDACFPIGAVPKSTPGKYRLIIDQSSGPHALNSTIPKSQVKVKLDDIHDLGTSLLAVRKKHPERKLCLFKSDVKSAYRLLPMDLYGRSNRWSPLMDSVMWTDVTRLEIEGWMELGLVCLFSQLDWHREKENTSPGYVDDNFGWEFAGNKKYYKPYKKHFPARQTRLLELWDELVFRMPKTNNSLVLPCPSLVTRLTRMR